MRTPEEEGIQQLAAEATELLVRLWGFPESSSAADLATLWRSAAAQGWFRFNEGSALAVALALTRVTGAAACPLPVMDGFVAARLLTAAPGLVAGIESGAIRIVVAAGSPAQTVPFAEAAAAATHVLVVPPEGGHVPVCPVDYVMPQPGLAVPPWAHVYLGEPEAAVIIEAVQADQALSLLRLGLAVRAMAAARRAHEQSVAHAKVRKQFGRPIGSFGVIQQRAAAAQIDLVSGDLLVGDAVHRYDSNSPDWLVSAELAVAAAAAAAPRVQVSAHRTLGAIGYFEEHDAPWLFRRVHADVARLQLYPPPRGTVADILLEGHAGLPAPDPGPYPARLREELRSFCAEHRTHARPAESEDDPAVVAAMAARGWLGMTWPAAEGGRDATVAEQLILQEEAAYHQLPVNNAMAAVSVIGTPIVKYGTAEQKQKYLPLVREGKLTFCLGYSEPEAGSDLSSLRTNAERDGDDWVISGQKTWITNAHSAEYIWLAARTSQEARPPIAGISMFIVPMAAQGITTRQHRALSGQISSTVCFDHVRVSDSARVGEVNRGWQVITDTLAGERLLLAGRFAAVLRRQLDELLAAIRAVPDIAGPSGSQKRARMGDIAVGVHTVSTLLTAAAKAAQSGASHGARLTSSMAGVLAAEVAADLGEAALEILGPEAALSTPGVPGAGIFEYGLRLSVLAFLGGGTNDVQRGLIARGLGLS